MKINPGAGQHTRTWGYAACAWCALFAVMHIFWAVGGDVGLASSAGPDLAARRPDAFVLLGLWGVALVLLAGAAFSVGLARWRPSGGLRRGMVVLGWLVGTVLLARALLLELVLLTGAGGVASSVGPLETRWSLILWNPWFALGGLTLVAATRQFQRV
ncbi:DUF3995 domain-containing protein [Actinoallomurus iriomotensis]|uniref:DUF3995 domain-containing protein n=1 Tax=Actinoallomurus iriomotensis TaxID=478107 RepID=UPI002555425E|nr:DUF3995 domain-containing protein [Actinoallomurus iriomotensis]